MLSVEEMCIVCGVEICGTLPVCEMGPERVESEQWVAGRLVYLLVEQQE